MNSAHRAVGTYYTGEPTSQWMRSKSLATVNIWQFTILRCHNNIWRKDGNIGAVTVTKRTKLFFLFVFCPFFFKK